MYFFVQIQLQTSQIAKWQNGKLISLDQSNNSLLTELLCEENKTTSIEVYFLCLVSAKSEVLKG